MKSKNIILLITHKDDFYTIDRVYDSLLKKHLTPIRINTDEFPSLINISFDIDSNSSTIKIDKSDITINSDSIKSVWLRKMGIPKIDENIDAKYTNTCLSESTEIIKSLFQCLNNSFWLDAYYNVKKSENKIFQLYTAKKVGLKIPKTLVTNNPNEVKEFHSNLNCEMITKLQRPITISMESPSKFFYTSIVTEDKLQNINSLKYCPMIFQERINIKRELRVIYVAGNFFTGKIKNLENSKEPDWRRPETNSTWEADKIPVNLKNKISKLMTSLGLNYGALDIIKTPDDEYIFLEVNPSGEWGMLEKILGYKISDAIANVLAK